MDANDRAARYSDLFDSNSRRASDCDFCPICSVISVVRNARPELLEHLAAAAREMMIVAGLLLEEAEEVVGAAAGEADATRPEADPAPGRLS